MKKTSSIKAINKKKKSRSNGKLNAHDWMIEMMKIRMVNSGIKDAMKLIR